VTLRWYTEMSEFGSSPVHYFYEMSTCYWVTQYLAQLIELAVNLASPTGLDLGTVQPVASRCADRAIATHNQYV
jgi:hypothetical protein